MGITFNQIASAHKLSKAAKLLCASMLISALPVSNSTADTNQVYLEQGGYVHFEAEDASTVGSWENHTELNDYTGTGYLEWTGPDYFSENNAGNGIITYHFRVETPGNYELRWRSRIAKGESNTESNDTWVRFSTGTNVANEEPLSGWTKVYMGEFGIWSWSARTVDHVANPVRQYFAAGDHTIEISGRSYGHAIDRIALYRYNDVNFDPGLNGTLALSSYARQDGSIEDPNPILTPNPATNTPEPEPESELDDRVNVFAVSSNSNTPSSAYCAANTLTLPATDATTLSLDDQTTIYNRDALTLQADSSNVLLAYDLTALPAFTSAKLQYATGSAISNGTLNVYLGSNNDWVDSNASAPDSTVLMAVAQGGWDSTTRYETNLDSSLLSQARITLIATITTGSDQLGMQSDAGDQAKPVLVLGGGNSFCTEWEANSDETPSTEPEENETSTPRRSGGALSYWLAFLMLASLIGRKPATNRS